MKPYETELVGFNGSSQKSLMVKIFAVGHRKIIDFPALAKNDKLLSFLQKSGAFLPQFNLYQKGRLKDTNITFLSNHSGGINGGLANGMPIICRVAVRPTPSVSTEQDTVNLETGEKTKISVKGRHDKAIILRIAPIMEAMAAIGILDLI